MKLRGGAHEDSAFDGLTAEEVRRIRGAAAVSVTPGMEGLAKIARGSGTGPSTGGNPDPSPGAPEKRKRGRRA